MENIIVNELNDKKLQKKIQTTAQNLKNKYSKQRVIKENKLKDKTKKQKIISIVFDVVCAIMVIFSFILCFSSINSKLQGVSPSFMGVSNLTVVSPSMVNSGLNIGDTAIVRTVNTDTLNENDIIAFYVYSGDYKNFDVNTCIRIQETYENEYIFRPSSIFGFQTQPIKEAGQAGADLVIHHIKEIYEDTNGTRWFKTYGSSNIDETTGEPNVDAWVFSENMILGLYDNGAGAKFYASIIGAVSSDFGLIIVLIPVILIAFIIISECIKDVELAKLELDCVEEKRKITDPICVKNNVGFNMDTKTKYKILAQATEENRNEYVALLWKDGTAPLSIKKYVLKKNILLTYNQKMLDLNRQCENMFKEKVSDAKIAHFYIKEKEKLEKEFQLKTKELRKYNLQAN